MSYSKINWVDGAVPALNATNLNRMDDGIYSNSVDIAVMGTNTKKLLKITYLCTFMVNSVILLCLSWILKCYGLSPETTQLSYILVMIHNGMAMFLWSASFVLPNMLRACNDVRFTMVLSIFSMFVFRIGFSYIIGVNMGYGAIGVWIAMVLDWIFRVICFVSRYLSGHWLKTAGLKDNR